MRAKHKLRFLKKFAIGWLVTNYQIGLTVILIKLQGQ